MTIDGWGKTATHPHGKETHSTIANRDNFSPHPQLGASESWDFFWTPIELVRFFLTSVLMVSTPVQPSYLASRHPSIYSRHLRMLRELPLIGHIFPSGFGHLLSEWCSGALVVWHMPHLGVCFSSVLTLHSFKGTWFYTDMAEGKSILINIHPQWREVE